MCVCISVTKSVFNPQAIDRNVRPVPVTTFPPFLPPVHPPRLVPKFQPTSSPMNDGAKDSCGFQNIGFFTFLVRMKIFLPPPFRQIFWIMSFKNIFFIFFVQIKIFRTPPVVAIFHVTLKFKLRYKSFATNNRSSFAICWN